VPSLSSTPTAASSAPPRSVVDTVILRYFALVEETDLLVQLLGEPLGTPRIIYDDHETPQLPDNARSEITRSVAYQQRASTDAARDQGAQSQAARNADRLAVISSLHQSGRLIILDLDEEELRLVGRLTSPVGCKDFGLRFALDPGEAACLAIAASRRLVLATDDTDALRALEQHSPGHPYERIRKLLIRAGDGGLCSPEHANEIHRENAALRFLGQKGAFPAQA
jgi:hypothetical protein